MNTRAARLAVLAIFFINGTILASWVPHIPLIQEKLQLGEGLLGVALLAMAGGAVGAMPLSGYLCTRLSSKLVTTLSAVLLCFCLPLPIIAPSFYTLFGALFLFGASNGAMDVAMNGQAVTVERQLTKPVMSSFHGFYSLGGLTGAAVGGFALGNGVEPVYHVSIVSIVALVAIPFTVRHFIPVDGVSDETHTKFALPKGAILGLGTLAFLVLAAEGAMADWTAVYLKSTLNTGPGMAAAGFAAFSMMMAVGRLAGDKVVAGYGPVAVTRTTSIVAAAGMALALLIPSPFIAIVGFGLVGLGLSNLIPVLFSAAGRSPDMSASAGIAAVATMGYFGLLVGPAVIGFVAELFTLPTALGLLVVAIGCVAVFARMTHQS